MHRAWWSFFWDISDASNPFRALFKGNFFTLIGVTKIGEQSKILRASRVLFRAFEAIETITSREFICYFHLSIVVLLSELWVAKLLYVRLCYDEPISILLDSMLIWLCMNLFIYNVIQLFIILNAFYVRYSFKLILGT